MKVEEYAHAFFVCPENQEVSEKFRESIKDNYSEFIKTKPLKDLPDDVEVD